MKRIILTLLLLGCSTLFLYAQKMSVCGSTKVNQQLMETNPEFRKTREAFELQWQEYNKSKGKRNIIGNDTSFEIPVVIHVIHNGEPVGSVYNPADTQLVNWINYTNQVFAAQYASYPDTLNGGTYFPIRFVLAQRDSNCNATSGIVRVNGSGIPGYTTYGVQHNDVNGATEAQLRALSHWPEKTFYNIYVVHKFDSIDPYLPFPGGSFLAGFAYFPGAGAADASFMLAYVAKQNNSTMPHEIGHALGLDHTFSGGDTSTCPIDTNCLVNNDKVCDTEPVKNLLGVFPCATNSQVNSCTGLNYNNTQKNIMGYGSCLDRFTPGQRDRAILQLITLRAGLVGSVATLPPGTPVTAATCIPTIVNSTNTFGMGPCNVTLNTLTYASGGYNIDGNKVYIDNSCALQTVLHPTTSYTLTVTTKVNPQKVRAYLDYNNDGAFASTELILDHTGTLADETHTATFTPAPSAVLDVPLRMRVVCDWASSPTPTSCSALSYGQAEDFGVFVSTGNPLPVKLLSFDAQAQQTEKQIQLHWQTASEVSLHQFIVERSFDGQNFTEITRQKSMGRASSYVFTDKQVQANQLYYYRLRSVDLDGKLSYSPTITAALNESHQSHLYVFPNPLSGNILGYSFDKSFTTAEVHIIDISGKTVFEQTVNTGKGQLEIGKLKPGIYLVRLQSANEILGSQKIVVE